MAQFNSATVRADALAAIEADNSGRLRHFHEVAADSELSVNVSADKIPVFDDAGEILDTRRVHIHQAAGNTVEGLRRFAASQGRWLQRREGFEGLWNHGRRLVYGAVNSGGMGTGEPFGPYCLLIFDPCHPAPDALAVFPGDSAHRYTDEGGGVNESQARAEATAWGDRADLAVIEFGAKAVAVNDDAWPGVVCRPGRYMETVRAGTMPLATIGSARIRGGFRDRLDDLQGRALAGDVLSPVERNEVAAYGVLQKWRRSYGTTITDVL